MKRFLAVYTGSPASRAKWDQLDPARRKELEATGIKAWGGWMAEHRSIISEQGAPLGKTKRVGPEGISETRNNLVGYVVVQAESHDAAAKLFEKHPHFTIFPGEAVEIMECLPIPGQPQD